MCRKLWANAAFEGRISHKESFSHTLALLSPLSSPSGSCLPVLFGYGVDQTATPVEVLQPMLQG